MRTRNRLAVLGWVLGLAGLVLPWTYNRATGYRWLVELLDRYAPVVALYAGGLAALALGVVMLFLRSPVVAVVLPAAAGLLTMIFTALATPRKDVFFDGFDGNGRPFGGSESTSWSLGPVACVLGAVLVLLVAISYARSRDVRR